MTEQKKSLRLDWATLKLAVILFAFAAVVAVCLGLINYITHEQIDEHKAAKAAAAMEAVLPADRYEPVTGSAAENIAEETGGKVVVETKIASDGMAFKQWNGKGHALSWTVDVPQDATYAVQLRLCHIASEDVRRTIAVDGVSVNDGKPFLLPGTGGWSNTEDNWRNIWLASENRRLLLIPLKAGRHVFTMTNVDDCGLNLDWIKFTPVE